MVTVIRHSEKNGNGVIAISKNNPEMAQIRVQEVRTEFQVNDLGSTFERKTKREAYVTISTSSSGNYYEGKEMPGQVVVLSSYTPFYDGQEPVMKQDNEKQWTIPFTDHTGRMIYRKSVYDASGKMEDKLVDAAALRAALENKPQGQAVPVAQQKEEPFV